MIVLFLGVAISSFTSCKKDVSGCTNPNADNYNADADNDDGSCILAREKFLGAFSAIETCGGGNDTYSITIIESGSSEDAVVLGNLYDWGEPLNATISGSNITIPSQLTSGLTFSGSGSISGNTLTINFTVSDGTNSDNCNAICTR